MESFRTNDNITIKYIDTAATDPDELKKDTLILVRSFSRFSSRN